MKQKVRIQWDLVISVGMLLLALLFGGCQKQVQQAEHAIQASRGSSKMNDNQTAQNQTGESQPAEPQAGGTGATGGSPEASGTAGADSNSSIGQGISGNRVFTDLTSLSLQIGNGTVEITPLAAGSQASASWTIEPGAGINAAAPDTLQLTFEQNGGELKIHDEYSGKKLQIQPRLHLTLSLPASAELDCALGNGNLSIDNNAELSASLGNGTLKLAGECPGSDVHLGNGKLSADWLLTAGKHHLSLGNGSAAVRVREGSSLSFTASTGAGGITLDGIPGKVEKQLVSQTASGSVGSGGAKLDLSVGAGNLKLSASLN